MLYLFRLRHEFENLLNPWFFFFSLLGFLLLLLPKAGVSFQFTFNSHFVACCLVTRVLCAHAWFVVVVVVFALFVCFVLFCLV